ncbi:Histone H1-delta [Schistosoma japonicum]|uniref:Histone H1-delta n=1 Tax=Schistosoma japonicum TaxID=6182 RepID=A0A4Z2D282_SCHJA|nr:Histone H1-delta [Schistosoma japonicum]
MHLTDAVRFPLAPYVSYLTAQNGIITRLGLFGSLVAFSVALLSIGWALKSRRRHQQKLLVALNRSSWLAQCYSRIADVALSSQLSVEQNSGCNTNASKRHNSGVPENSPTKNVNSKHNIFSMYNSYEDNLNTNVEPRLFTRNICHGRKQRTSKHLDIKYHKPKDLLNDDKFDVNHNTNVDSDRVSKQTDSFSSNSLTHSDSSFNTSKYQQIELIEDTDENHQHCPSSDFTVSDWYY